MADLKNKTFADMAAKPCFTLRNIMHCHLTIKAKKCNFLTKESCILNLKLNFRYERKVIMDKKGAI